MAKDEVKQAMTTDQNFMYQHRQEIHRKWTEGRAKHGHGVLHITDYGRFMNTVHRKNPMLIFILGLQPPSVEGDVLLTKYHGVHHLDRVGFPPGQQAWIKHENHKNDMFFAVASDPTADELTIFRMMPIDLSRCTSAEHLSGLLCQGMTRQALVRLTQETLWCRLAPAT